VCEILLLIKKTLLKVRLVSPCQIERVLEIINTYNLERLQLVKGVCSERLDALDGICVYGVRKYDNIHARYRKLAQGPQDLKKIMQTLAAECKRDEHGYSKVFKHERDLRVT